MKENVANGMNFNNILGQIITELGFIMWGLLACIYMGGILLALAAITEFILIPAVGYELALPLSGLIAIFCIFVLAYYFICCIQFPRNDIAYWILGGLWVLFIVSFEYIIQVVLLGRESSELARIFLFDGVVGDGIYVPIILPVVAIPWMLSQLRRNAAKRSRALNR